MDIASSSPPKPMVTRLSVVTPFLNEAEVLPAFCRELRTALDELQVSYEVLFVDDGSTDEGLSLLVESLLPAWQEARVVKLTRNFGHMAALTAGLDLAVGDYVACLDADLQHPPEVLAEMVRIALACDVDVVQGLRDDRLTRAGWFKRMFSRAYYMGMTRLSGVVVRPGAADFRVMSRRVVDDLKRMPETTRVYRLLIPWLGYPTAYLTYPVGERGAGASKYTIGRMLTLGWASLRGFSTGPLRIATATGILIGLLGVAWSLYVVASWGLGNTVPGWSALMCAVLILGGVQLVTIGIVGEYLGVVLEQVRGRPSYVAVNVPSTTHQSPTPVHRS